MDFNDYLVFQIRNISYLSQIHKPIQYISASVTPWHKINRGKEKEKQLPIFTSVITIELSMYRETRASVYLSWVHTKHTHACTHTGVCTQHRIYRRRPVIQSLHAGFKQYFPWRLEGSQAHATQRLWFIPIFIRRSYGLYKARHLLRNGHRFPCVDHSNWIA